MKQIVDKDLSDNLFIKIFSITFQKDDEFFDENNNVVKIIDFIDLRQSLLNNRFVDAIKRIL